MPKFGSTEEEPVAKPAMDEIPPATKGAAASINQSAPYVAVSVGGSSASASQQLTAEAQMAKIELEKQQWEAQNAKESEHWMKSYWRPAMGWLYMLMCFCDFVAFPIISMFMPQFIKGMTYIPWKSITLDNGGLIHMAFGAILGVAAWTRGQEKIAGKN
jgi:uncharacterized membrane protein